MTISLPDSKSAAPPKGFYTLVVSAVKRLTKESVHIVFDVPEDLTTRFQFKPGQHLDLILIEDGQPFRRSYSICSGPNEPLSIAVKAVLNGKASPFLTTSVRAGTALWVSEPKGSFVLSESAKTIVLIAAGSGITPLLSMAKSAIERGVNTTLLYGNRTASSIMFSDEINAMRALRTLHYLSGEPHEGAIFGRLTQAAVREQAVKEGWVESADAYYLCGPGAMTHEVKAALTALGVAANAIHIELFSAADLNTPEVAMSVTGPCQVSVKLEGDRYAFSLEGGTSNLLAAAIKAGLDAPYSCRTGVCGSCRAKIITGAAKMTTNYALTDEEVADGYILTCQAIPTSAEIAISFDV